jgi:hypothetical protein
MRSGPLAGLRPYRSCTRTHVMQGRVRLSAAGREFAGGATALLAALWCSSAGPEVTE